MVALRGSTESVCVIGSFLISQWALGRDPSVRNNLVICLTYDFYVSLSPDLKDLRATGLACVAYYCFDLRDLAKKNCSGLLCSLLEKLSAHSSACYEILGLLHVLDSCCWHAKANETRLTQCLNNVVSFPGRSTTYIRVFVGALDEPNFSGIATTGRRCISCRGMDTWRLSDCYSNTAPTCARNDEGRTPASGKGHKAVVELLSGCAASNA